MNEIHTGHNMDALVLPNDCITSIMVVTYNRLELTKRFFESLLKTTPELLNGEARLIIVDNGSKDGTVEYLEEMQEKYSFISDVYFYHENKGIGVGRSKCLQLANRYDDPYLATLDNDVELPQGWLTQCIDILKSNPEFALGVNMEGKPYPMTTRNGKTFQLKPAGNLGTACTVFPRMLHLQIGYFITEFGLYGEEDADFFFRARCLGYQMGYLEQMGNHFGEGELDQGEYREFKTKSHNENYKPFIKTCHEYSQGKRPLYIPFDENPKSINQGIALSFNDLSNPK